ncbi:c-type cytochrome [Sphingomonas naphthae]|uniref:C-type cytochrome n=1 Tax=Sphingomonas naphthae TaxID=1813468 RepID=A0ABY7TN54_9SPHN|nr:c-type cytochrome [Sphingomonas naphthae]WCT74438.1 c-type cytochrome [Sphingomonas naphthae]
MIVRIVAALALASAAPAIAQQSGEQLFRQRCQACHATDPAKPAILAPNLRGVVGRKAAATPFAYSPALKAAKLTWSAETLDAYLAGPAKLVPGTRMMISIADARQRAALIDYLATLK